MKTINIARLTACALVCAISHGRNLVGKPCLFNEYFPEWRCFPAILRDDVGNLSCGRNLLNNGGATLATPAAGPVCATAARYLPEAGPQFHFSYRDPQGGIQDLWHTRHLEKDKWYSWKLNGDGETPSPLAAGNPSGLFHLKIYHVMYRDLEGGIQDLAYNGAWHAQRLNNAGLTSAPAAVGDPLQVLIRGQRHVIYRDREGGIQDLWSDKTWHSRQLNNGGLTQAPAAAGEPAGLEYQGNTHVTYRDHKGQIQDVYFDGAWHVQCLNAGGRTGAPSAAGDPGLMVVGGGIQHVAYRDQAGTIQDLWFDGAWHAQPLNNGGATDAPGAASEPCLLVPPSNWEYVAYVDVNGDAQLLTHFPEKGWAVIPLDENTPPGGPVEKWRPDLKD